MVDHEDWIRGDGEEKSETDLAKSMYQEQGRQRLQEVKSQCSHGLGEATKKLAEMTKKVVQAFLDR